jgi:tetratricopeptide (TPR) repeat protein
MSDKRKFNILFSLLLFFSLTVFAQEENKEVKESNEQKTEEVKQSTPAPKATTESSAPKAQVDGITEKKETQTAIEEPVIKKPAIPVINEKRLLDAIEADPKNPQNYLTLIKYYQSRNMRKELVKIAISYIQNIGGNSYMYQIIGDENRLAGDYSKALISYQYALKLSPTIASLYNKMGLTLLKLENYHQAEAAFKAAIFFGANEDNYTKAVYYNNLAASYEAMNVIENAIKYYKLALKFNPYYTVALDNLKRLEKK